MAKNERKFMCWSCNKPTKHIIRAKYHYKEIFELRTIGGFGTMEQEHEYLIAQCAGCEHVSLIDVVFCEGNYLVFQYPEPINKEYKELFLDQNELIEVSQEISNLYQEVTQAYKSQTPILCGVGLRILVEAICIDQQIKGSNLMQKIKGLKDAGLISAAELPILDKLRDIGNAAAHEIKAMEEDTLKHALLIINHIIRSIYILPLIGKKIETPKPRKKQ